MPRNRITFRRKVRNSNGTFTITIPMDKARLGDIVHGTVVDVHLVVIRDEKVLDEDEAERLRDSRITRATEKLRKESLLEPPTIAAAKPPLYVSEKEKPKPPEWPVDRNGAEWYGTIREVTEADIKSPGGTIFLDWNYREVTPENEEEFIADGLAILKEYNTEKEGYRIRAKKFKWLLNHKWKMRQLPCVENPEPFFAYPRYIFKLVTETARRASFITSEDGWMRYVAPEPVVVAPAVSSAVAEAEILGPPVAPAVSSEVETVAEEDETEEEVEKDEEI